MASGEEENTYGDTFLDPEHVIEVRANDYAKLCPRGQGMGYNMIPPPPSPPPPPPPP